MSNQVDFNIVNSVLVEYLGNQKELVIPDNVTVIGDKAFCRCSSLTSVIIPDSVESIGNYAFYNCTNLASIKIPYSVESIGDAAFYECESLTSVTFSEGLMSIGRYAFYYCARLTNITIPNSVTSIGTNAFLGCPIATATIPAIACSDIRNFMLKTVVISGGTFMGNSALSGCSNLENVTIGKCVTSICTHAFYNCKSLKSIIIPGNVESIEWGAFENCTSLINVTIQDGVACISSRAFSGCTNLKSITFPDSVTLIGEGAFEGCTSLESIIIPDSIICVGKEAFEECPNLKFNKYDNAYYLGNDNNPYLVLVKEINKRITSCDINSLCKVISDNAFDGCKCLKKIIIPGNVKCIGDSAFSECNNLKSATILEGVEMIDGAFSSCEKLENVRLPNTLKFIDDIAFQESDAIKFNKYDDGNYLGNEENPYLVLFDSSHSDSETYIINPNTKFIRQPCFSQLVMLHIPYGVKSIGRFAFRDRKNLRKLVIPDSIEIIGEGAFVGADSLIYDRFANALYLGNEINPTVVLVKVKSRDIDACSISASAKVICDYAFAVCKNLKKVSIPKSIVTIGNCAFRTCENLTSIIIPDSVKNMGEGVFEYCPNLTIYCEASSKPSGWSNSWNSDHCPVVWGYKK